MSKDSKKQQKGKLKLASDKGKILDKKIQPYSASQDSLHRTLYRISELTHSTENMDAFFAQAHTIVGELIYAENFFIALYDEDQSHLSFPYIVDSEEDISPEELKNLAAETLSKTLTGYMLRSGEMLHADNKMMRELTESGKIEEVGKDSREWVGIPLKKGDRILGGVVVQSYDERFTYSTNDLSILQFLSQHLATVLARKQAEEALIKSQSELEKRVIERTVELADSNTNLQKEITERKRTENLMQTLYQIAVIANEASDIQNFYSSLHDLLDALIRTKNLYVVERDQREGLFFDYYQNEFYGDPSEQPHLIHRIELEHIRTVLDSKRSMRFSHDERIPESRQKEPMFSSWLGVPLVDDKQNAIGVIAAMRYNVEDDFSDEDQSLLSYVAQQISSSLQRQYQRLALMEAHTQLQKANSQLELRVEERTRMLQKTNEELQETIEQRKLIEAKLAHDAFHDSLTQLPNRALFLDRLEHAIKNRMRHPDYEFAVMFLDLDRFKVINDSLGHHVGDQLLKETAEKLLKCIRPGDTVARLGGDEFAILLISDKLEQATPAVTARISETLKKPFEIDGNMVFTSASIGINLCDGTIEKAADVLRDADSAMYEAKSQGKAQHAYFDQTMYEHAVKQLKIESELRRALDKDQILVHYQPIVDLETDTVIAFEALARWHHPIMGWISPVEFIPIAEETGLISDIGLFILDKAIEQCQVWQNSHEKLADMMISVNLSSYQLAQVELYENSMQIIRGRDFPCDKLRLEVTESLLINNFESAKAILARYADAGIKILLDDFGTGYSS
ncbi:MAG: diguanylate cyclase, partial [Enterobacterales bacterium]|nr:diguanylate cyclase [Enterobacterales bacterium]